MEPTEPTDREIADLSLRTMEAIETGPALRALSNQEFVARLQARLRDAGGTGSGNFGHGGRPGEVGGSGPGGGGSEGGTTGSTGAAPGEDHLKLEKGLSAEHATTIRQPSSHYTPINSKGKDTQQRHRDPSTKKYTPERQALHRAIVTNFLTNRSPVPVEQRVATVLGGGPASGKSTLEKAEKISEGNVVLINPDAVKEMLPEFREGNPLGERTVASGVHEESSDIAKQIMEEASKNGYSLVLDGTGDSSLEKLGGKVAVMRAGGAKVVGKYVSLPTDMAVQLAKKRGDDMVKAGKVGRYVPEDYLRMTHRDVSNTFAEALKQGLFDEADLYDTTKYGDMKRVVSAKGKDVTIHDQKLWDTFLAKGQESWLGTDRVSKDY